MKNIRFKAIGFTMLLILPCIFPGCVEPDTTQRGVRQQESVMERAMTQTPVPIVNHFVTRKTVEKWIRRMDVPNKLFYIYVYADTGNLIGYYVAQSRPVSICTFLTPPVREYPVNGNGANPLGPAPTLDGVYYGQGGGCDQWYFFDAETDALIELVGFKIFSTDQPLSVNAERIRIKKED